MNRPNVPVRRRLRWTWLCVGGFVAVVYLFGYVGFDQYSRSASAPSATTWLDKAYLTGQLFTIESGGVVGPLPWTLEVARFLAPIAAAVALIHALVTSFSFALSRLWLRLRGGHVIVGGLGEKGVLLVRELLRKKRRVVVIDPDSGNPGLWECRQLGALVMIGRADDTQQLRRACVINAAELIVTSGSDSVNLGSAALAKQLCANRASSRPPLRCIVHVSDPALQEALKRRVPFAGQRMVTLEVVNVFQTGARVMLERSGIFAALPGPGQKLRLLILGLGSFGQALFTRILRDWAILREERAGTGSLGGLEITLAEFEASEKALVLRRRLAPLLEGIDLLVVDGDVREPNLVSTAGMDAAFVCFNDDALATLAALRLEDREGDRIPVYIRMVENAGFSNLFRETAPPRDEHNCCTDFTCCAISLGDITEMSELFLNGDREILARAFHAAYLAERSGKVSDSEKDRVLVPWEDLIDSFRESNRAAADGVPARLAAADLRAVPSPDRAITLLDLSEDEVGRLAEHEHRRWCEDRRNRGFRHGPKKDEAAKIHPLLRPWETLSPEEKAYNLADSRRLPFILARADLEIVRERGTGDGPPDGAASIG